MGAVSRAAPGRPALRAGVPAVRGAGVTPLQCLAHLQTVHAEYQQEREAGVPDARQRHQAKADHGIREYIKAVDVEKAMEALL